MNTNRNTPTLLGQGGNKPPIIGGQGGLNCLSHCPPPFDILVGDAGALLRTLPSQSIHCAVTSPPFFLLRDYGHKNQIGLETHPDEFIAKLVAVFRELKRVLRDDGCLFVNIADTYAGDNRWGIPRKSLLGIPWLLAFALRADGWIIRSEIVWHKKNCTPESARDRPTRCHEQLFLFTKKAKYHFDGDAIREPNEDKHPKKLAKQTANLAHGPRRAAIAARRGRGGGLTYSQNTGGGKWGADPTIHGGFRAYNPRGRNRRSVWTTTVGGFKASSVGVHDVDHFALFPTALVRPCVLAGTSAFGACAACGSPYVRHIADYEDLEDTWLPSCSCGPDVGVVPCTVLDPFAGAATTGVVCLEEGRKFIGLEINPDYARLGLARLNHTAQKLQLERGA